MLDSTEIYTIDLKQLKRGKRVNWSKLLDLAYKLFLVIVVASVAHDMLIVLNHPAIAYAIIHGN